MLKRIASVKPCINNTPSVKALELNKGKTTYYQKIRYQLSSKRDIETANSFLVKRLDSIFNTKPPTPAPIKPKPLTTTLAKRMQDKRLDSENYSLFCALHTAQTSYSRLKLQQWYTTMGKYKKNMKKPHSRHPIITKALKQSYALESDVFRK